MKADEINQWLAKEVSGAVLQSKLDGVQPWIQISPDSNVEVLKKLRDGKETAFDFLRSLGAIDYGTEIEVVYLLFSYSHRHEITIKLRVPKERPVVKTVESVWPAANWYEREAYDLLGVEFEGHSDLRRIMLPDDWIGHPLRKDYKEQDEYRGVSTRREYLTGMPELPTLPPVTKQ